jgi:stage III sporulation protein AG
MGGWLRKLEEWLGGAKRAQTVRWLLIVGLTGVAIMIVNSFLNVKEVDPIGSGRASPEPASQMALGTSGSKEKASFAEYEHEYEMQLKDILQKIVGVGEVEVMVTVDSTEEQDVEKNEKETQQVTSESDPKGATRHITETSRSGDVVMTQSSGDQRPLVTKQIKPKIRGVLVVAKGAENLTVKKMILEAVERGLEVPAYKISVAPRKQG